jgi:hypothetical protein
MFMNEYIDIKNVYEYRVALDRGFALDNGNAKQ